ncbi:MAG: hypothetical protein JRN20_07930 [Nitrososphaerota archaeon]|nr:hypothetical protein [Nitrososphaerota archaeon]
MEKEVNLAAIMFTDIVGYTTLTQSDENLALTLLEEHRKIVRPLLALHNGKEVKTIGDAFLVEFRSAVEAIKCALEIQESLNDFNSVRNPKERITLRIGIHLGDVIHSGADVYGDAVNVASRIEALSEPGGIAVSRQIFDSAHNKIRDLKFESLGSKRLKNISEEIEVFKVLLPWIGESNQSYSSSEEAQPKNRVAVLPFVNISPDPQDEFFADGLTEELISRLSQAKELRVIARTSAMNYKGEKQKKIRDIGRELGAGIIVEGSVRKAGSKIRVNVQVVNALSEDHLWSRTYDRNLDDIFEIQTDIATKVADSFSSQLAPMIRKEIRESQEETHDVTAYTYFLQGRNFLYGESESSVKQAFEFLSKAIDVDPSFARAYVGRAECQLSLTTFGRISWVDGTRKAEKDVLRALDLDPDLAEAHATLSRVKYCLDEFAEAEAEAKKAVELNPSLADAYHALGHMKWVTGQVAEGIKLFETAHRLDPLKEEYIGMLSELYLVQGRSDDALRLLTSVERLFPQTSYSGMTWYYLMNKDLSKATEYYEKFCIAAGDESIYTLILGAVVSAYKGDREKALDLVSKIEKSSGQDTVSNGSIGEVYYLLGDMDKFFEYMNRAMDVHALPLGDLVNSPLYEKARMDPRMKELLERVGLGIELSS